MGTYSDNWHTALLLTHGYLYFGQQHIVASCGFIPTCALLLSFNWNLQFATIKHASDPLKDYLVILHHTLFKTK